jgi:hypothetical protein
LTGRYRHILSTHSRPSSACRLILVGTPGGTGRRCRRLAAKRRPQRTTTTTRASALEGTNVRSNEPDQLVVPWRVRSSDVSASGSSQAKATKAATELHTVIERMCRYCSLVPETRRTRLASYAVAVTHSRLLVCRIAPTCPGEGRWTLPAGATRGCSRQCQLKSS